MIVLLVLIGATLFTLTFVIALAMRTSRYLEIYAALALALGALMFAEAYSRGDPFYLLNVLTLSGGALSGVGASIFASRLRKAGVPEGATYLSQIGVGMTAFVACCLVAALLAARH